ncbi:ATP-dependent RNA helicase DDX24 [Colossoma macropomum]|uniref:ATP-dependent RNA helicase DDX24 n=1 Tax=Colossoma macropomum TaxID=42526 RepID=UPI001863E2E3|nr:ATP-dependent RNA helicase DDX24 [Colossoma macropomum]XP_036449351.1 ATP-dependent RNA helicase DDX24 [Colossoma macropomum]
MKTKNSQSKKRFRSAKKRGILVKGKWQTVKIDPSVFADEGMSEIVCFEELTDYSLIESEKTATVSQLLQEPVGRKKKKNNKRKACEIEDDDDEEETFEEAQEEFAELSSDDNIEQVDIVEKPAKKRKKKKKKPKSDAANLEMKHLDNDKNMESSSEGLSNLAEEGEEQITAQTTLKSKNKKKKKKQEKSAAEQTRPSSQVKETDVQIGPIDKTKRKTKNWTDAALSHSAGQDTDISAWKDLFVPAPVLKALSKLGFSAPTPIQALALPPAIRDHMDILGAAETGSGKTLSFGIPMIHTILEWKKTIHCKNAGADGKSNTEKNTEPGFSKAADIAMSTDNSEENSSAQEEGNLDDEDEGIILESAEDGDDVDGQTVEEDDDGDDDCGSVDQSQDDDGLTNDDESIGLDIKTMGEVKEDCEKKPLLGLVLTPTRELAVQVKHHIDAVAQFTGIRTAILVGGMAPQKQDRMLKRKPEIVIATPGRLWEMVQDKHPHLRNLRQLRCLVIDEADRMVEKGHFAELEKLLEILNTSQFNPKRQTFVFSATLTMVHSLPTRLLQKKGKKLEERSKLELLMEKVGIKGKPKVIDLTRKEATVETLTETRIHCEKEEKDFYLYYFLMQYPGRTMVFANSIDCIKRLTSLLTILDCTPLPLHANMHQKQRLKNLERFAERESCVLLTTDVAARGLDIPDVQHVIHYQVPRTSETYVHRSGRTARAAKEGLSLLLIGPDDMMNFKKIYRTLGKDEDLPLFPVQNKCMTAIKERVDVARKIEKIEYHNSREKQHNSWFRQAAEEMDIDLDDDLLLGAGRDENEEREQQKLVKGLKKHLKHLLTQPIFKPHMKTKYPTQMGKLQLPELPLANETALISVTNQRHKQNQQKRKGNH